jgi:hypothetical protein
LSRKLVHILQLWWQIFRWWRRGWNGGAEVAETTTKRLLYYEFRRTVYQCWLRICPEINVFLCSNITCFRFYNHLWTIYWLSIVH